MICLVLLKNVIPDVPHKIPAVMPNDAIGSLVPIAAVKFPANGIRSPIRPSIVPAHRVVMPPPLRGAIPGALVPTIAVVLEKAPTNLKSGVTRGATSYWYFPNLPVGHWRNEEVKSPRLDANIERSVGIRVRIM
jgi:hypothetical protein